MNRRAERVPGVTVCSRCAGETLRDSDPAPGGQLVRLSLMCRAGGWTLTEVECLDKCDRGDVVVVRPSPDKRELGRPQWFAGLAGQDLTAALDRWLAGGGPGIARPEPALEALRLARTDRPGDQAPGHALE